MFFKVENTLDAHSLDKHYCTAPHATCKTPRAAARPSSLHVLAPAHRYHLRHDPPLSSFTLSSPPSVARRVLSPRSSPSRSKSDSGGDRSSSYLSSFSSIIPIVSCRVAALTSRQLPSMPPAPAQSLAYHFRHCHYNDCCYSVIIIIAVDIDIIIIIIVIA